MSYDFVFILDVLMLLVQNIVNFFVVFYVPNVYAHIVCREKVLSLCVYA